MVVKEKIMQDDKLNIVANLAQLYNLYLLFQDLSNTDIAKELQKQNTNYFDDIVARLDRIEEILNDIKSKTL